MSTDSPMSTTTTVTITPDMAREMLASNTKNRELRTNHAQRLAGAMARGEWVLTHQGIAFDESGRLIDGQHRLRAIVLSGVTVQMMVTRGVSPDTFHAIDQNARRNTSDFLGVPRHVADMLNLAGYFAISQHPSPAQLKSLCGTRIFSLAAALHEHAGAVRRFWSSAPVRLAAVVTSLSGESERAYAFSQYKALVHMDVDDMSSCTRSLLKQADGKVGSMESKRVILARSLVAFDKRKADLKQIRMSERDTAEYTDRARSLLLADIAAAGVSLKRTEHG